MYFTIPSGGNEALSAAGYCWNDMSAVHAMLQVGLAAMAYSSAEDGDDELAGNFEDLAEIYGTPPIRHVQSKKDVLTGKGP